jgi:hypothetical protein
MDVARAREVAIALHEPQYWEEAKLGDAVCQALLDELEALRSWLYITQKLIDVLTRKV